jgi:hypothetical protein
MTPVSGGTTGGKIQAISPAVALRATIPGGEKVFAVRVECYAGYRGEETPRRLYLGERRIEVLAIVDRWLGPDHRYFKLRGDDDGLYIIRYDSEADVWELILYDSGLGQELLSR